MPSSHEMHEQVPCIVTAYVDKGIKELVELLNTCDKLSTFESCQGRQNRLAFVHIIYDDWDTAYDDSVIFIEMAHFVNRLAIAFAHYTKDAIDAGGNWTNISIEWRGDKRFPFISIEMPPCYITEVTRLLSLFLAEYKNGKLDKQLLHSVGKD
ncbi:hypothetical protein ACFLTP_07930 [Chloroflexota bacterium]